MKYIVLFLSLCFLCSQPLFGQQEENNTLTIKRNRVYLNDSPLSRRELKNMLNAYPDSKKIMAQATSNYNANMIFGIIGGFCIGYGFVSGALGNDSGWIVAGAGAGLTLASFSFFTFYNEHVRNAVGIYNDHVRIKPATLQIGTFSSGVGVRMRF
jgi:hypothetical protein